MAPKSFAETMKTRHGHILDFRKGRATKVSLDAPSRELIALLTKARSAAASSLGLRPEPREPVRRMKR
jgi:hypothetical protein